MNSNLEDIRMSNIEEMSRVLADFNKKKAELFPDAEIFERMKAASWKNLLNWLNDFSQKINIELWVTVRTEAPHVRVRFFTKEELVEGDQIKTVHKYEFLVGNPGSYTSYDEYELSTGMFLRYKQNDGEPNTEDRYDKMLNIMPSLSDKAVDIKNAILSAAEKKLFEKMTEEGKELEVMIKIAKNTLQEQ